MKRIALWLMTATTGWMALRSLRAEERGGARQPPRQAGQSQEGAFRDPRRAGARARRPWPRRRPSRRDSAARLEGHPHPHLPQHPRGPCDSRWRRASPITSCWHCFPGIAALVSIYGMIANPADIGDMLASLAGTIPKDVIEIIRGQLTVPRIAGRESTGPCFLRRPARLAVELQRRDQGAVRRAQRGLWRKGEA